MKKEEEEVGLEGRKRMIPIFWARKRGSKINK